jgi:hypothetical protein
MSATFSDSEIETLRRGAMGAGLLVSVSDRGFFDTFKEAGALAKHVAAARGNSDSALVRRVAEGRGTGFGVTTPPAEVESGTLEALRSSIDLLLSLQRRQAEKMPKAGRSPRSRPRLARRARPRTARPRKSGGSAGSSAQRSLA